VIGTVESILDNCRLRGIALFDDGKGGLTVEGPERELSDDLLRTLADRKPEILASIARTESRSRNSRNVSSSPVTDNESGRTEVPFAAPMETNRRNTRRLATTKDATVWFDFGERIELPAGSIGEVVDPAVALADDPHRLGLAVERLNHCRRRFRPAVAVLLAGRVRVLEERSVRFSDG
jgi:hypothetical protein